MFPFFLIFFSCSCIAKSKRRLSGWWRSALRAPAKPLAPSSLRRWSRCHLATVYVGAHIGMCMCLPHYFMCVLILGKAERAIRSEALAQGSSFCGVYVSSYYCRCVSSCYYMRVLSARSTLEALAQVFSNCCAKGGRNSRPCYICVLILLCMCVLMRLHVCPSMRTSCARRRPLRAPRRWRRESAYCCMSSVLILSYM